MKVQMHSIKFDADSKLIEFIQKKMDKLDIHYDRVIDGEVYLKLNNERLENKTIEIKLNVPGLQLFSKEQSKTFEQATDLAVDALKKQLQKFKEKQNVH